MLYIVPTPIGNLGDISQRAVEVLRDVSFIASEDTRVTLKLLNHLGIKKTLVSYHEHNSRESGERIVSRLEGGKSCALVVDAGTPCISDPGNALVALCHERGVPVTALPGPCAAVTALSLSGIALGRFCFEGFLSMNKRNRREHLASLLREPRPMVFYEAPHKLTDTLACLQGFFGDRRVIVCRELTKLHEQVLRTTLSAAAEHFSNVAPRGEFVLVVEGSQPNTGKETEEADGRLEEAVSQAFALVGEGSSRRDASRSASEATGVRRSEIYARLISPPPNPGD